ncbi:MAG: DASS family sodium-coupled anion symporter [Clostridia bacterium]|nr:DASS family sodium-coupled anion symporter [Clostridia bacterium]
MKNIRTIIFYATLLGLVLMCALVPQDLASRPAIMAGGLLVFAILNWILETVPIAVSSLVIIVLVPFTGLRTFSQAIAGSFGNSIFGFFLGVLLLSSAFKATQLGELIARFLFRVFGSRPRFVVLGIMTCGALLAMWITEVAAAAVVFPIAMSIWERTKDRNDHAAFGRAIMLGVAWGCAFGGVATPIATGANLIAIEYLESMSGITITFGQWMLIGVPICITLLLAGWLVLTLPLKNSNPIEMGDKQLAFGPKEIRLAVIFLLAVLLWIFGDKIGLGSHHVALLAAIALFLPGVEVMEWKKAIHAISWDSIMLIACGVLLGDLLHKTGVAEQLANALFMPGLMGGSLFVRGMVIVLMVSVLKILFSSNTVSGIVLVPIMISLANANSLSPWGLVAPCIFTSALSLIVISSSPVNVIPYASKAFTPKDMARYGIIMTLLTAVIIGFYMMVFNVN